MTQHQPGSSLFPPNPRFACIGEAMIELSYVDLPRRQAQVAVAGDTYNTAVYLARTLGAHGRVDYVTALGQDALSDEMISSFRREGLGTDLIPRHPTRTVGLYGIQTDAKGERSFSYWRAVSAARDLFGSIGPDMSALDRFDAVYLSGITLAILPEAVRAELIACCKKLKSTGTQIIFDSNYRPQLWNDPTDARDAMDAMWRATTIALPSVDDEAVLHPDLTSEDLAVRISDLGPEEVVMKQAAAGPLILHAGTRTQTAFPRAERVVDTTAAGDSFNAGYLAARAHGADPLEAARSGHELAIQVIGISGAIAPRGDRTP